GFWQGFHPEAPSSAGGSARAPDKLAAHYCPSRRGPPGTPPGLRPAAPPDLAGGTCSVRSCPGPNTSLWISRLAHSARSTRRSDEKSVVKPGPRAMPASAAVRVLPPKLSAGLAITLEI